MIAGALLDPLEGGDMNRGRVTWIGILAGLGLVLCLGGLRGAPVPAHAAGAGSPFLPTPPFGPPREIVLYAHAKSLVRRGRHWELRVDPAQFLSGLTAQRAAVEDGAIAAGDAVPNDYYTRDESHRLLTFRVAPRARITVIAPGLKATAIAVPELADPRRQEDRTPAVRAAGWVLDSRRGGHGARDGPAVHALVPLRRSHGLPDAWVP